MLFTYYAKKVSGEETKGTAEAGDRFELAKNLRQEGYILISCKEQREKKKFFSFSFSFLSRVPVSDKIIFSRNLSVMVSAGLSLVRAMETLSRQTKSAKFTKILTSLTESVQKGKSLSESMKDYPAVFSPFFVSMIRVGEESGQMNESLKLISEQMENDHKLLKKIKGAMIYPAVILVAMILIGVLMFVYVVPTLLSTFKELNVPLPASTQAIVSLSNFFINNKILMLIVILVLIFTAGWFFRSEKGKRFLGRVLLHLPIFSMFVKKINSARTCRTLASLIAAGVNVIEALEITRDVIQNYRYKAILDGAKNEIQKGNQISEVFKKADNLYPVLVGEIMAVGEETGKMSEMLSRLAIFYEEEVSDATKDLATIIEPALMVLIGAAVGFFAISMIQPMYSVMNTL